MPVLKLLDRNHRPGYAPYCGRRALAPGKRQLLSFWYCGKELVIGTLGVLYGVGEMNLLGAIQSAWTPLSAYAYMIMTLIYVPCVATIAAIRRETGSWKWTGITVAYTITLGWVLAVIVYQVGTMLGLS